jgi:hypothetical protein
MITAKEARKMSELIDIVRVILKDIERNIDNKIDVGGRCVSYKFNENLTKKHIKDIINTLQDYGYKVEDENTMYTSGWYKISW